MNGEGYRDPTADRAIRNAGRLPRPIWNVVKAVQEVLKRVTSGVGRDKNERQDNRKRTHMGR